MNLLTKRRYIWTIVLHNYIGVHILVCLPLLAYLKRTTQ